MDCDRNTYDGLLERCGCTESSNTTCVTIACIVRELHPQMYAVSQSHCQSLYCKKSFEEKVDLQCEYMTSFIMEYMIYGNKDTIESD